MSRRAVSAGTFGRSAGMTLIELILFIVIVSVGLAGMLTVFNMVVSKSADPMTRKQVLAVAEATMEEVLLKDFANPTGGYSGTDRKQFDDVGDYAGYSQTGIKDIDGVTAVSGLEGYTVSVAIDATAALGMIAGGGGNVKKITVTVTGGSETVSLVSYRTNYE